MMLELRGLQVSYGPIVALHGVDMSIAEGEAVTVNGANGAGKSTLLKAICGLLKPRAGEIRFRGRPIAGQRSAALMQQGLALVPEGRHVFPRMTVRENLELGAYYRRDMAQVRADLDTALDTFPILHERLA